ncbi:MAG: DNA mismatch repair endonuclease MutL [Halobacteriota archaeon]
MTVERLPPETVERIAAGEVVTRPSSVVKELLENSLDAGAKRVEIAVDGDGTDRIRVADDGCGMSPADAALAVEPHTTSKLPSDGVEHPTTLGFRGEALSSIAAVSTLEILTNGDDDRGTRVVVEQGEVTTEPAGRATGTTVEVSDLFYNRQARRTSVASSTTEFGRISDVVSRYALVRPDVRFSLEHDGRSVLSTPGSGDYADALLGVYDRTVASESTTFVHGTHAGGANTNSESDHPADSPPAHSDDSFFVSVAGALCYPSVTRATRDHVAVAVNGRALRQSSLRRAVVAGYGELLPAGRYPIAAVDVTLPPGAVDANVHPAKVEVALRDAPAVTAVVESAVSEALSTADLRRTAEVATDLDSSLEPVTGDSVFDTLSVIGQYRGLYLLCEADDDLLVVDQHAAHERVTYERLKESLADEGVPSVPLDPPQTVSLSAAEAATVEAHRATLAELGFELDSFGGDAYRLTRVPAPLGRVDDAAALRDGLDALRAGDSPEDRRTELLKDLACHPSLKAGDAVGTETAAALIDRLGACEQPYACPHGRPTVLSISEETLARGFERHGTRFG